MQIKDEWFKKDFKQIFYLFCRNCNFQIYKFGELKNKQYISQIKIEEHGRTN